MTGDDDKQLKGLWPFTNLVRRCPECGGPHKPKCTHCGHMYPLQHNALLRWLDRWSMRLAGVLLITTILGALAWANVYLWVGVVNFLS